MSIAEKTLQLKQDFDNVYEAGKQANYDLFWDAYQENGNRTTYQYGFARVWNDDIYNPKYAIICNSANVYTAEALFLGSKITDTKVPITISGTRMDTVFQDCTQLKTIRSLTLENIVRFASNAFRNCKALEELNMYGTIDVDGLNLSAATKLNKTSWISIINALSSTTSGLSITGSLASIQKAFETSEGANDGDTSPEWEALENTKTNWTINLT